MTTPARRTAARRTVAYLRRQAGYDQPRMPAFGEVLELGEAYVAEVGDGTEGSLRRTLGETGQVYVTLAAAQAYGAEAGLGEEEARHELTALVLGAKESSWGTWRFRRRSEGVDINACVSTEGPLLVVTSIMSRAINVGGKRG